MEWVARRGRKGRWQGASEAHPHRGCNKRATQPAALLPRALKGCVDFGAGLRCSLGRDRCGYRRCASRLGQHQNPQQRGPLQFSNSLPGDSFSAGNDIQDFLKNPTGAGESPQARLIEALINFDKPIVVAVQGAAIGGGTTMLTHCDFVFAAETAKFRMPFIDLAVVPEFGTSYSVPARIGYVRAAELVLLGLPIYASGTPDI